jgi:hypothetical protein
VLHITIHESETALTFQLEGRLAGSWVPQLEACMHHTLLGRDKLRIRFDLTDVTLIDAAGKDFLTLMHLDGAEFLAGDCLMSNVITAIAQDSAHERHCRRARADFSRN